MPTDTDNSDTKLENNDESDDESNLFDNINEPYTLHTRTGNIREIPDNFASRKDTLTAFTNLEGNFCDKGARILKLSNKLSTFKDAIVSRARVIRIETQTVICLPIKEKISTSYPTYILSQCAYISISYSPRANNDVGKSKEIEETLFLSFRNP